MRSGWAVTAGEGKLLKNHGAPKRFLSLAFLALLAGAGFSCKDTTGPEAIDPPSGVTVTLASPTSARITWTASPQADKVRSYNVFRNGQKLGEVTTTTYSDDGLTELTNYKYAVSANAISGIVSALSPDSPSASITVPDATPPRVLSISPVSGATGVALSSTISATFSESVDPATLAASSFVVKNGNATIAGTVAYTAATHVADFTPSSAMPNAAQISVTIGPAVKDLAGNSMTSAFVSTFTLRDDAPPTVVGVTPASGSTLQPVNTAPTVTFSRAMNPATLTSATITLTPGGGSPIGTSVTSNASTNVATITPLSALAFGTQYTLTVTTGAAGSNGIALASASSSTFSTIGAPDTTRPTIVSSVPGSGATDVATSTAVVVTFSEAMISPSVNASTLQVTAQGGGAVAGSVTYDAANLRATFTPSVSLLNSTVYTVNATTGMTDLSGNSLVSFSSSFTTVAPADVAPPGVSAIVPANGTTNVAVNVAPTVTFNRAMSAASLTSSTITVVPNGGSAVATTVSYNAATNTATITPSAPLPYSTTYALTVTTGVRGSNDVALPSSVTASFATVPAPDATSPTVVSMAPPNGTTNISVSTSIVVTFSESMNASTVSSSTLQVSAPGIGQIPGTTTYDANNLRAIFIPSSPLQNSTTYTVSLTTGMTDLAGNALVAFSGSFTTVAPAPPPDTTRPTVISVSPANGATGVATNSTIVVNFSEPMNASTVNGSTLLVADCTNPRPGSVTYDAANSRAIFTPAAPMLNSTNHFITVSSGMTDLAGNALVAFSSSFVTAAGSAGNIDLTGPTPFSGTTCSDVSGIHIHIAFTQTGQTLTLGDCSPDPRNCGMFPLNQAAANIVGPNSTGEVYAKIASLTGTLNGSQLTFTITLDNTRSFTFTGSAASSTSIAGTLSGATLPAVGLSMER